MSRRQVRRRLDRWLALAGDDRRVLVALAVLLPAIGGALRIVGVRRTYRMLGGSRPLRAARGEVDEIAQATAKRLGRLVDIASRHGPYKATCLRQSLALWWMLRRLRLPAELRIGVGKDDVHMRAHAWVELGGQVINDRASITDDYAVYADLNRQLPRRFDRPGPWTQRG